MRKLLFIGLLLASGSVRAEGGDEWIDQLMKNHMENQREQSERNQRALDATLEDSRIRERMRYQAELNKPSIAEQLNRSMQPKYAPQAREPVICNHVGNMTFCN